MRYIGCKTLLLENIKELIDKHAPNATSFCDVFSGTATVARYFKQWYEVYSNDLLYFSYVLQMGTIKNDSIPTFNGLRKYGISDPIDYFNNLTNIEIEQLPQEKRYFQNTYAPKGGRMYLNDDNALRIDYARNLVDEWYHNSDISKNEYYYLVACIVEGIPFVSNISGTYGAFHKQWDKRSYKKYELFRLDIYSNGRYNKCYNEDGVELLKRIQGDILYIDPPYNGRQYLPNYHVLETAAKYDSPIVKGITGVRDYDGTKSMFCLKTKVKEAFEELMNNANFKHIILSYSTDGIMKLDDIEQIMCKYGVADSFEINRIPYRRYKSRSLVNNEGDLSELLVYIEKRV